jgi:hypothetical protein
MSEEAKGWVGIINSGIQGAMPGAIEGTPRELRNIPVCQMHQGWIASIPSYEALANFKIHSLDYAGNKLTTWTL